MRATAAVGACWLLLAAACSDDGGGAMDAGTDAALIVDLPADPAPPNIPWYDAETDEETLAVAPPAIAPCPEGWREVMGECDPWPETGRVTTCPLGTAHFPGEPDCAFIGTVCPPGDFALGLPDDGSVLFVLPTAGAGGDGSRAAPFRTVAEALAVVTSGQTIALAKGTYDETVALPGGVTLAGACAAETQLSPTSGSAYGAVYTDAGGVVVADLSIVDPGYPGIAASGSAAEMTVTGVLVGGAYAIGVIAGEGATLSLDRVVVRGTRANGMGDYGRAVLAQEASQITLTHALLETSVDMSVMSVGEGTTVTVRDSSVRETTGNTEGYGRGVWATMNGSVVLERVEVADQHELGIIADDGGSITGTLVILRDTVGYASDFVVGPGAYVSEGGTLRLSRAVVRGNHTFGVNVGGGGQATLEDVVVRDTEPDPGDGSYGFGIVVVDDGHADVSRALLSHNHIAGIRAARAGAELVASDVDVHDVLPDSADGTFGRGIEVVEGASLTLRRARIERNRADGVFVTDSSLDAEDVFVADTASQDGENDGRGITCGVGSTCAVHRAVVARNGGAGVMLAGTSATVEDVVARDTADRASGTIVSGVGIDVRDGVEATVRRALARDNGILGVSASGAGTALGLEDATIDGTRGREGTGALGVGLVAVTGAALTADRVIARHNRTAGVYVADDTTSASLTDLRVEDTASSAVSGRGGDALMVTVGATASVSRAAFERNHEVTFLVAQGAVVDAAHVTVLEPLAADCGERCSGGFGYGLLTSSGGRLSFSHFRVDGAPQCGVRIAGESALDLADGEIAHSDIAACVQTSDYDLSRLTQRVRYLDNRVNIEAVDFAVPEPEVSFDDL